MLTLLNIEFEQTLSKKTHLLLQLITTRPKSATSYVTRTYLLSLVPNLNEGAIGAGLGDLQVSLSAGSHAEVLQAAFLALIQQSALASGPQWGRAASGRDAASAHTR